MDTLCPYCKSELSPPPKRMKACPKCGNNVYVRSTQDLLSGTCFTFETAMAIDAYKENLASKEFIKDHYAYYEKLLREKKGKNPTPLLIVWEALKDYANQDNTVYYSMALLLGKLGKDPNPALERYAKGELIKYRSGGLEKVEILSGNESCDECINQRKEYTIDEALRLMPLSNRKCSFKMFYEEYSFCRCTYLTVLED
jgi:hypothetical protein